MKQQALHHFSASALRGNSRPIQLPLMLLCAFYLLYAALLLAGSWLLVSGTSLSLLHTLLWCGGRLLLSIGAILLTMRCKVHILSRCTRLFHLSAGDVSSVYKRLLRLCFWKQLIRLSVRLILAGGLLGAALLLEEAAARADSIYWLMGAAQVIPLTLGMLLLRLRFEAVFAAAEVLCVQDPAQSAFCSLRTAFLMMQGQYRFLLRILLRSLPWMLLPAMLPRYMMNLTLFFSVRHLEWQYSRTEGSENRCEPSHIQGPYPKPHEAGGISAP
ncbi:MAG: hypothetical protein IJ512_02620 [Ruminococcus sp.]|nr:hypothetical protein [Ruminococcus sp.]